MPSYLIFKIWIGMFIWSMGALIVSSLTAFLFSRLWAKPNLNYWNRYTMGVFSRLIWFFSAIFIFVLMPEGSIADKTKAFYGIVLGLLTFYLANTLSILRKAKREESDTKTI